ncbi:MAG TPA: hypothetical protein VD866_07795 [Urbifossiella sp.]|nr:hypothetical protein [Urbifossiella sp.]
MDDTTEIIARLTKAAAAHDEDYLTVAADDLAALVIAAAPRLPKADRTYWATIAQGAARSAAGTADLHRKKHLAALLKAAAPVTATAAQPEPEPEAEAAG